MRDIIDWVNARVAATVGNQARPPSRVTLSASTISGESEAGQELERCLAVAPATVWALGAESLPPQREIGRQLNPSLRANL